MRQPLKIYLRSSAYGNSDGISIGTIIMRTSNFLSTSEGSKYLLCDVSEIPSSYPKLRSLMTHTPDLRDRVPQGAGTYTIGTQIKAEIPNIKGGLIANWYVVATMSGPFYIYIIQHRVFCLMGGQGLIIINIIHCLMLHVALLCIETILRPYNHRLSQLISISRLDNLSASAYGGSGGEAIGTCDGSTFSAAAYPKLYQILGTTTLPDLRERFLEGREVSGTYIDAGLPNITGTWRQTRANGVSASGAIAYIGDYSLTSSYSATYNGQVMSFNAARCSVIYGRSNTVQPPAYTVRYYIQAK